MGDSTILQPIHYNNFSCSGGACKRNCCDYNWDINIDKKTYDFYMDAHCSQELKEIISRCVIKNPKSKNKDDYARIIQDKEQVISTKEEIEDQYSVFVKQAKCPFMEETGLCRIHKELGAEALSKTCQVFPRIEHVVHGKKYRVLVNGCEEVLKLHLNNQEGITFEYGKDSIETYSFFEAPRKNILKYYEKISSVCIDILQTRQLSLDHRMILLGEFLTMIDQLVQDQKYQEFDQKIEDFIKNIDQYLTLCVIEKGNYSISCNLFAINAQDPAQLISTYDDSKDMIDYIIKLNHIRQSNNYDSFAKMLDNRDKIMAEYEYYIENIFVTNFFYMVYPINRYSTKKGTVLDDYYTFIWGYCFYKILLACALEDSSTFDEEKIIDLSVLICRQIENSYINAQTALDSMRKIGFNKMSHIAALIKNS